MIVKMTPTQMRENIKVFKLKATEIKDDDNYVNVLSLEQKPLKMKILKDKEKVKEYDQMTVEKNYWVIYLMMWEKRNKKMSNDEKILCW